MLCYVYIEVLVVEDLLRHSVYSLIILCIHFFAL